MQTSKKQLIEQLLKLVDQWNANGRWETEEGNSSYGNALQNCSDELLGVLKQNIDDVRDLA